MNPASVGGSRHKPPALTHPLVRHDVQHPASDAHLARPPARISLRVKKRPIQKAPEKVQSLGGSGTRGRRESADGELFVGRWCQRAPKKPCQRADNLTSGPPAP